MNEKFRTNHIISCWTIFKIGKNWPFRNIWVDETQRDARSYLRQKSHIGDRIVLVIGTPNTDDKHEECDSLFANSGNSNKNHKQKWKRKQQQQWENVKIFRVISTVVDYSYSVWPHWRRIHQFFSSSFYLFRFDARDYARKASILYLYSIFAICRRWRLLLVHK